jgi:hypothetical protein
VRVGGGFGESLFFFGIWDESGGIGTGSHRARITTEAAWIQRSLFQAAMSGGARDSARNTFHFREGSSKGDEALQHVRR